MALKYLEVSIISELNLMGNSINLYLTLRYHLNVLRHIHCGGKLYNHWDLPDFRYRVLIRDNFEATSIKFPLIAILWSENLTVFKNFDWKTLNIVDGVSRQFWCFATSDILLIWDWCCLLREVTRNNDASWDSFDIPLPKIVSQRQYTGIKPSVKDWAW